MVLYRASPSKGTVLHAAAQLSLACTGQEHNLLQITAQATQPSSE